MQDSPDLRWHVCDDREGQFKAAIEDLRRQLTTDEGASSTYAFIVPSNAEVKELSRLLSTNRISYQVLLDEYPITAGQEVLVACVEAFRTQRPESLDDIAAALDLLFDETNAVQKGEAGPREAMERIAEVINSSATRDEVIGAVCAAITNVDELHYTVIDGFPGAIRRIRLGVQQLLKTMPNASASEWKEKLLTDAATADMRGRAGIRRGVVVLTMHKAKGKEFDEVYFFTPFGRGKGAAFGWHRAGDSESRSSNLNLWHVAVTRSRRRLHMMYSETNPSTYLLELGG